MEITIKQFSEILEKLVLLQDSIEKLWARVDMINERTKGHTIRIKQIEKEHKR